MEGTPEWVDPDDLLELIEEREERRGSALATRGECLVALDAGDVERAERAKREYQLSAYETRQAEGEILWAALGHAVTDLASWGLEPEDGAVEDRGQALVDWAVGADSLASIRIPDRVRLIVARRFPTAPAPHQPYITTMFEMSEKEIADLRERDRRMLDAAGWLRRGRTAVSGRTLVSCARCGYQIPVQAPEDAAVSVSRSFTGGESEMREICPHCERDIFVSVDGGDDRPP